MRSALLVLVWIAATAAATGLAWAGVRSVVDDVAAPLPPPVTAARDGSGTAPDGPATTPAQPEREPGSARADETIKTFTLTGGTVTVEFSAAGVDVLSAVPAQGFAADVEPEDGRTRVEFESDSHRSRIDTWWDGQPRHNIDEDAHHDDDDDDDDDDD